MRELTAEERSRVLQNSRENSDRLFSELVERYCTNRADSSPTPKQLKDYLDGDSD